MGCNCKKVEKITDIYDRLNGNKIKYTNVHYSLKKVFENIINGILNFLMFMILLPLIMVDTLLNLIFTLKVQSVIIKLFTKYIKR